MARVTLIHVLESDCSGEIPDPVDTVQWHLRRKEASRFLATVASAPICQDLQMDTELGEGCAFEQIQTWSNLHGVDITVLSTHGERGYTHCELASTAHKLINGSSGSLLVVPVGESSPTPSEPVTYKRVLVPLDGSHHAESVLPIATQLAEAHRAELILAHVVPTPELIRIGPPDADDLELEESLIRRNEKIAGRYLTGVQSHIQSPNFRSRTYLSRKGDPRDELLRIIYDESVDLVVLSAHGATGATDRALGTVAAHLVAHARVPLLLTRERTRCTAPWDRASAGRLSIPMRLPGATAA
jgi:nucleotide-binding universal stress UspA family protein